MIMDDNWGLHAVVHGFTHQQTTQDWNNVVHQDEIFDIGQPIFSAELFPPPSTAAASVDFHELEDLYKPFCIGSSDAILCGSNAEHAEEIMQQQQLNIVKQQQYEFFDGPSSAYYLPANTNTTTFLGASASNRVKRKNQQKRVVQHVTANGLFTDLWAWRKYGQKPIKGSFYPRSYYRCSSSKGCAARKQVEQSSLDPNIFTITYTADHNHPHPTRRSSLSGVSKNKKASSSAPSKILAQQVPPPPPQQQQQQLKDSSSSNSLLLNMSPSTPLMQDQNTREDVNNNNNSSIIKKEESVTTTVEDSIMGLGLDLGSARFEEEMAEMGFDGEEGWFPHWLESR